MKKQSGGTFLWASLVLKDISDVETVEIIEKKLDQLPPDLAQVYGRILENIGKDYKDIAKFILRVVVVARRPLTVSELAMVRALDATGHNTRKIPAANIQAKFKDSFKCCGSLLYLDEDTKTVNLVHQSAKDYLVSNLDMSGSLSHYCVRTEETHLLIFEICCRYLSMEEWDKFASKMCSKYEEHYLGQWKNSYQFVPSRVQ